MYEFRAALLESSGSISPPKVFPAKVLRLDTVVRLSFLCRVTPSLRAGWILLNNGKITNGSVVGYEGEVFRLRTEYGFALIRRDNSERHSPTSIIAMGTEDERTLVIIEGDCCLKSR